MKLSRSILFVAGLFLVSGALSTAAPPPAQGAQEDGLALTLERINVQLASRGEDFRVAMAEWLGGPGTMAIGQTVVANDRGNKQLDAHFVPGDARRGGFLDIAYLVDTVDGATASGLTAGDTTAAIDRAMATWDSQRCSDIPVTDLGAVAADLGVAQFILGFGGTPLVFSDLTHAGWLPAAFFEALQPGGGTTILGATLTFVWFDGAGNPTDIDGDGKDDVAFRETYYNDAFAWAIDGNVDVETVVLHESGHGLSQGHFGKIFITEKNGKVHFAPRALMNALYSGLQQRVRGTDNGGHCSIWGSWPNQ